MIWGNFSKFNNTYSPEQAKEMLPAFVEGAKTVKTNKKIVYYNIPCAFDIETSSFFRSTGKEEEKVSIMYEWTLGINGGVIIGRTWDEFLNLYNYAVEYLTLCNEFRLIIYVHNLSFEFQFIRKLFNWENVFSLDVRKPCYALTTEGVEFRCSYLLSGYSLEKLGDQLRTYVVKKMVGDLDYSLIRHSSTVLTEKELGYCENDVRVVMSYIQEKIEDDGDITKIPLTKTGYVRNYCRNMCMYEGSHKKNGKKYLNYRKLMQSMTLEPEEYIQLKRAFQGGFTHANAMYSGKVIENVGSFDFTSSYPYVIVSEMFPMSKGEKVLVRDRDTFNNYLSSYCCLFDVEFFDLYSLTFIETPLSASRCYKKENVIENNGRIVSAGHLITTITEQDYYIYSKFYSWREMRVSNFIIYKKGYLPTDFVKAVLKLYENKTTLKDVDGKEIEYLKNKEMVNATFGMTVTDICREECVYIGNEWQSKTPDIKESIEKYNNSKRRFLFYPWGVWITAYARKNLFSGIASFGVDYVYSDTDSVKGKNPEKHMDYINAYNELVRTKLIKAAYYHNIDFSMFEPKTIKGKKKLLGVWDDEGIYSHFKTLGAKRYMVEKKGKINITVSGVNKKSAVPYLLNLEKANGAKSIKQIFDCFTNELYIPKEYTGKNTHTYIDDEKEGYITDYNGNTCYFKELSGVHLEPADYSLSLALQYVDYLKGFVEYEN